MISKKTYEMLTDHINPPSNFEKAVRAISMKELETNAIQFGTTEQHELVYAHVRTRETKTSRRVI
jgi:hypothetical protein